MKLVVPFSIEKQFLKLGISIQDLLVFLKKTYLGSNKFIEVCAPMPNTKVFKAYLSPVHRAIIVYIEHKGIVYPVYVGNKGDKIAKNITVDLIRKNMEFWQERVLEDIKNHQYRIRHY